MSQENLEIVRNVNGAFNRRDIDALIAFLDPSIEWWPAADELATGPVRGHDGRRRGIADLLEVGPDIQAEIEELFAAGDDQVVVCLRYWGHGRESGVPVEIRETQVHRLRGGKIIEVREYREKAEALEAVGLRD
jgi:ketosteroid isomerase-like protein